MYQPKGLTTFSIGNGAPRPYPYGGRTKPSIIARLRRLRTSAIAGWRPRLLLRGWRQICFYSFDLAGKFIRAFCRLTPRLGLKEMALWTDCAVKLARLREDDVDATVRQYSLSLARFGRFLSPETFDVISKPPGRRVLAIGGGHFPGALCRFACRFQNGRDCSFA